MCTKNHNESATRPLRHAPDCDCEECVTKRGQDELQRLRDLNPEADNLLNQPATADGVIRVAELLIANRRKHSNTHAVDSATYLEEAGTISPEVMDKVIAKRKKYAQTNYTDGVPDNEEQEEFFNFFHSSRGEYYRTNSINTIDGILNMAEAMEGYRQDEKDKVKRKEFNELAKPLIKFLADNYHPHTNIYITNERAVISEDDYQYIFKG